MREGQSIKSFLLRTQCPQTLCEGSVCMLEIRCALHKSLNMSTANSGACTLLCLSVCMCDIGNCSNCNCNCNCNCNKALETVRKPPRPYEGTPTGGEFWETSNKNTPHAPVTPAARQEQRRHQAQPQQHTHTTQIGRKGRANTSDDQNTPK